MRSLRASGRVRTRGGCRTSTDRVLTSCRPRIRLDARVGESARAAEKSHDLREVDRHHPPGLVRTLLRPTAGRSQRALIRKFECHVATRDCRGPHASSRGRGRSREAPGPASVHSRTRRAHASHRHPEATSHRHDECAGVPDRATLEVARSPHCHPQCHPVLSPAAQPSEAGSRYHHPMRT